MHLALKILLKFVGNFRCAVSFGKIVEIECRDLDIGNTKKLKEIEGIKVIENLDEIEI